MRKLLVSFTGTLGALKSGKITESDLETAIFYFRCCREHAIDPWKEEGHGNEVLWFFEDDLEKGREVHAKLVAAIEKAEAEGRIAWPTVGEGSSYEALSGLLTANGLGAIAGAHDGLMMNGGYCYPGVTDRVKEAGLDLEVIWR